MVSKTDFHTACLAYIRQRVLSAQMAIQAAQESANTETKSSAGDKYETGREMANQERARHAAQLYEARQQLLAIQKLDPNQPCDIVRTGALVQTNLGLFYLSVGAGKLRTTGGQDFLAVSLGAPVMQVLAGMRTGEAAVFNGKPLRVEMVS